MSIWSYKQIKNNIELNNYLTLNEGNTPVDKLKINDINILLKREDTNPTGSWKDRGTAYKISKLKELKIKEAVISSSGNAAISYLEYANKLYPELKLNIIVSKTNIDPKKLEIIKSKVDSTQHTLYQDDHAKKLRAQIVARGVYNLSASIDSEVLAGYWSLGFEIYKITKNMNSSKTGIFVPVSSGTALVGMIQGLSEMIQDEYSMPKIIVCQTSRVHPVVDIFNKDINSDEISLADSIVDKSCLRSPQIVKIIKQSNGDVISISNDEILNSKKLVQNLELSNTSLLSIAGVLKIGKEIGIENAICIASGR